ncbi:MAG: SBBP repeat-containing protein, partial [Blastocatellia bacterium]
MSLLTISIAGVSRPTAGKFGRDAESRSRTASRIAHSAGENGNPIAAGTAFNHLPVRFEVNAGQTDSRVRFIASTPGGDMFLTLSELVMRVFEPLVPPDKKARKANPIRPAPKSEVVRLRTVNANPNVRITGLNPLPGTTNYFLGNDPKKWRTNVPSYARVKYENIYPGIDLIYYGNDGNLEYDFDVAPGADPKQIALSVEGGDGARIDEGGNLVLGTSVGTVIQHAPRIYQKDETGRHEIAGGYALREDGRVAFDLEGYDRGKTLVIDPEVVYSTYFGESAGTVIDGIAVDANGSVYVVGDTYAHDFPTQNPIQGTNNHSQNYSAIISKFSPDGLSLVYSTYLGGSGSGSDFGIGIALDSTGATYVTGLTDSTDFPTIDPIQSTRAGAENLFISKINADGSTLLYSTYLGGNGIDVPYGIQLDSNNDAYVYGSTTSTNFPTVNPTQASFGDGAMDGFFSVIDAGGSKLDFSTYVGSGGQTYVNSLVVIPGAGEVEVYFSQNPQPNSSDTSGSSSADAQTGAICTQITWHYVFSLGTLLLGLPPTVDITGRYPIP